MMARASLNLGVRFSDDPKEYSRRYFRAIVADPEKRLARNKRMAELRRGKHYPAQIKRALAAAKRAKADAERRIAKYEAMINSVS